MAYPLARSDFKWRTLEKDRGNRDVHADQKTEMESDGTYTEERTWSHWKRGLGLELTREKEQRETRHTWRRTVHNEALEKGKSWSAVKRMARNKSRWQCFVDAICPLRDNRNWWCWWLNNKLFYGVKQFELTLAVGVIYYMVFKYGTILTKILRIGSTVDISRHNYFKSWIVLINMKPLKMSLWAWNVSGCWNDQLERNLSWIWWYVVKQEVSFLYWYQLDTQFLYKSRKVKFLYMFRATSARPQEVSDVNRTCMQPQVFSFSAGGRLVHLLRGDW